MSIYSRSSLLFYASVQLFKLNCVKIVSMISVLVWLVDGWGWSSNLKTRLLNLYTFYEEIRGLRGQQTIDSSKVASPAAEDSWIIQLSPWTLPRSSWDPFHFLMRLKRVKLNMKIFYTFLQLFWRSFDTNYYRRSRTCYNFQLWLTLKRKF